MESAAARLVIRLSSMQKRLSPACCLVVPSLAQLKLAARQCMTEAGTIRAYRYSEFSETHILATFPGQRAGDVKYPAIAIELSS
jgi:hypothetical protein